MIFSDGVKKAVQDEIVISHLCYVVSTSLLNVRTWSGTERALFKDN